MRQDQSPVQGIRVPAVVTQQQYFPYDEPHAPVDVTACADVSKEFEPGPNVRSEIYL